MHIYFGRTNQSEGEVYYKIRLAQFSSTILPADDFDSNTVYNEYLHTSDSCYVFCNEAWKGSWGNNGNNLFSFEQHGFVEAASNMDNPSPIGTREAGTTVFYPAVDAQYDITTIGYNYYLGHLNANGMNSSSDVYLAFIVGGCGIIPNNSNSNVESTIDSFYFNVMNSQGNAGGNTAVGVKDNLPIITNATSDYRGTVSFRNCGDNSYISIPIDTSSGTRTYNNGTDSSTDIFLEDGTVLKYYRMYSYVWKYNGTSTTGNTLSNYTSFGPPDSGSGSSQNIENIVEDWRRFICVILYKVINTGILKQLSLKYSPTVATSLYTQLSQSNLLNTLKLSTLVNYTYHGSSDPDDPGTDPINPYDPANPILNASNPNSNNSNLNEESDAGDYHILGAGSDISSETYYFVTSKCADISGSGGTGYLGIISSPDLLHDINYYFGITLKATKYEFNYKYKLYLNSILPYSEDDTYNGTYYIGKSFVDRATALNTKNLNFYFLQDYKKALESEEYESTSCSSCVLELIPEEGTGFKPGRPGPANKNADVSDTSTGQGCVLYNSSKPYDFVFPLNYQTYNSASGTTNVTEEISCSTSFFGGLKYLNIESPLSGSVDSSVCWSQNYDNGNQDVCSYTINVPAVNQTIDLSNLSATHTPFGYTQSWKFIVKPLVGLPEEISEFTTTYNINCHFLYYGADLPYTQSVEAINTINDYSGFDVSTGEDEFGNEIDDKYMTLTGTVLHNTHYSLFGNCLGLYDSTKNVPYTSSISGINNRVLNSTVGLYGAPDASTDVIRKYSAPVDDNNPSNTDENMCIRKRYVPFETSNTAALFGGTSEINNEIYKIWPEIEDSSEIPLDENISHNSPHLLCTFSGTISDSSSNIRYSES